MNASLNEARIHLNTETGFLCRYVKSNEERFGLHYHDYYEIFMMVTGKAEHTVNGKSYILTDGQLLFIRDFDAHCYKSINGEYFEFINICFSKELLDSLFLYLGDGFPKELLFSAPFPPTVTLSLAKRDDFFFQFTHLSAQTEPSCATTTAKIFLHDVFTKYFNNFTVSQHEAPLWLETVCERMKKPKYFTQGVDKMFELSGKSREHLARSMKKYYHTSPSEYVTDLRLEYSVTLLTSSTLSATDICFECGFGNLSWFYKLFIKKYGITPVDYRKKYSLKIPDSI